MTALRKAHDSRRLVPHIAAHEGIWDGVYRYYDAQGNKVDEHRSRLICRFPDRGPYPYHQTNIYEWPDGRTETRQFLARIEDGRLLWQGELIRGWAAEVSEDEHGRTTLLYWIRNDEPAVYLYEMIQVSDCGRYRSRVWQWFRDGRLLRRTLIDEEKVSSDWSAYPV